MLHLGTNLFSPDGVSEGMQLASIPQLYVKGVLEEQERLLKKLMKLE